MGTSDAALRPKVAIVIGIAGAERLPYLGGARNGARAFAAWAKAMGYETHLIQDKSTPEGEPDPTDVTVRKLGGRLKSILGKGPIGRLIIYFAGHGLIREMEEGVWLLSDWRAERRGVAFEALKRRLFHFDVGQIAIFSDACRDLPKDVNLADMTFDSVLGDGPNPKNPRIRVDKFVAAQDGKQAFMLPGESEANDLCIFSGVLMEGLWGLRQEARSKVEPDKVTSLSLGSFLEAEVDRRARTYELSLVPSVTPVFPEKENYYFGDGPMPAPPQLPAWPDPATIDTTGLMSALTTVKGPSSSGRSEYTSSLGFELDFRAGSAGRGVKRTGAGPRPRKAAAKKAAAKKPAAAGLAQGGAGLVARLRALAKAPWRAPDGFSPSIMVEPREKAVLRTRDGRFDPAAWRVDENAASPGQAPAIVEFADGVTAAVTALSGFRCLILRERPTGQGPRGVSAIAYEPDWAPAAPRRAVENAFQQLEQGGLRSVDAINLAAELREGKHRDPVLGVISAYLYDAAGDIDSIRRVAGFYIEAGQPVPYDIAMLAMAPVSNENGVLQLELPKISASLPRTDKERERGWTYREMPALRGPVAGFWPMMRQGWAYLDAADGDLASRDLIALAPRLTSGRFTTFTQDGGQRLARLFGLG